MAIILEGKTECSICGKVLEKGQEIIGFPHFIGDRNDPLWAYSDSGMHKGCFQNWKHKDEFTKKLEHVKAERKS
jgi:hypothetical protein